MTISSLEFASGAVVPLRTLSFSGATALAAGPGVVHYFDVPLDNVTGATHLLTALCTAYEGAASPPDVAMPVWAPTPLGAAGVPRVLSFNEIALAPPHAMVLPTATVSAITASVANVDGTVDIGLTTDKTALYVTLTTQASGRFSDNAFALISAATVRFIPFGALDLKLLRSTLRVEHLQENL